MANVGAKQSVLGDVHKLAATIFLRVLQKYNKNLDELNDYSITELMEEELIKANLMPSPAMMNAIANFLKQNNIEAELEEVKGMTELERSLKERAKHRSNIVSLASVKAANE